MFLQFLDVGLLVARETHLTRRQLKVRDNRVLRLSAAPNFFYHRKLCECAGCLHTWVREKKRDCSAFVLSHPLVAAIRDCKTLLFEVRAELGFGGVYHASSSI